MVSNPALGAQQAGPPWSSATLPSPTVFCSECAHEIWTTRGKEESSLRDMFDVRNALDRNRNTAEKQQYRRKNVQLGSDGFAVDISASVEDDTIYSGKVVSTQSFLYGTFAVVALIPSWEGSWPAVWTLASNAALNNFPDGDWDVSKADNFLRLYPWSRFSPSAGNDAGGGGGAADRKTTTEDGRVLEEKNGDERRMRWPLGNEHDMMEGSQNEMRTTLNYWNGWSGVSGCACPIRYEVSGARHFQMFGDDFTCIDGVKSSTDGMTLSSLRDVDGRRKGVLMMMRWTPDKIEYFVEVDKGDTGPVKSVMDTPIASVDDFIAQHDLQPVLRHAKNRKVAHVPHKFIVNTAVGGALGGFTTVGRVRKEVMEKDGKTVKEESKFRIKLVEYYPLTSSRGAVEQTVPVDGCEWMAQIIRSKRCVIAGYDAEAMDSAKKQSLHPGGTGYEMELEFIVCKDRVMNKEEAYVKKPDEELLLDCSSIERSCGEVWQDLERKNQVLGELFYRKHNAKYGAGVCYGEVGGPSYDAGAPRDQWGCRPMYVAYGGIGGAVIGAVASQWLLAGSPYRYGLLAALIVAGVVFEVMYLRLMRSEVDV